MKLLTNIFISVLLAFSSSGFRVDVHYCHEQRTGISLGQPIHSCCETPCQHCHDEYINIHLDTNLVTANYYQATFSMLAVLLPQITKSLSDHKPEAVDQRNLQFDQYPPGMGVRLSLLETYRC